MHTFSTKVYIIGINPYVEVPDPKVIQFLTGKKVEGLMVATHSGGRTQPQKK